MTITHCCFTLFYQGIWAEGTWRFGETFAYFWEHFYILFCICVCVVKAGVLMLCRMLWPLFLLQVSGLWVKRCGVWYTHSVGYFRSLLLETCCLAGHKCSRGSSVACVISLVLWFFGFEGKAEPTEYDVQYDIRLLYLDVLCYSLVKGLTVAKPCDIQQKQYSVLIGGLSLFFSSDCCSVINLLMLIEPWRFVDSKQPSLQY